MDDKGTKICDLENDPARRQDNIKSFLFKVLVNPKDIDNSITEPAIMLDFALRLPQQHRSTSTADPTTTMATLIRALPPSVRGASEDLEHGSRTSADPGNDEAARTLDFMEPSATPKMAESLRRARQRAGGFTYTGNLAFLDSQEVFDSVFKTRYH